MSAVSSCERKAFSASAFASSRTPLAVSGAVAPTPYSVAQDQGCAAAFKGNAEEDQLKADQRFQLKMIF
jgi:hypothetical protein